MLPRPRVEDEERGRIKGLHEAGWSNRAIARWVGRTDQTVARVIYPPHPNKPKKLGRPAALSDRETRLLVRKATTGNFSAAQLKEKTKTSVHYTKMDNTLDLTPEHKRARMEYAKTWLLYPSNVWPNVIFSDEKKWNLDGPDGYQKYWQDLRLPKRQTVRRQNGGGSLMVWGSFSRGGKSELAVLIGKQNSNHYVYTLSEYMLPYAHKHYGTEYIFQQDNASIHTSECTTEFFEEQDITVMKWPARSPDLNPIENLWAILSRIVYDNGKKQYTSVFDLRVAALQAWDLVDQEVLEKLVDSMPKRLVEVLEMKGGKTHY
ncbi:Transposase, partial [Phytophthora megakarya]